MEDFKEKLYAYYKAKSEINGFIWDIFYRYKETKGFLFSGPEYYEIDVDDDRITFIGEDGCMGCYDEMRVHIPMKFFTNTEEAFEELKKEIQEEKDKEKRIKEKIERDNYERLKAKFETSSN